MAEGKAELLKADILKLCDCHEMDAAGLTPLHRAAQRGLSPDMVSELLHLGVSPHVLTPDGMTPADLARRAGHEEVLAVLTKHQCGESPSSPEELQNELFTLIIQGDHVQKVSRLLCKGVPIEPIASDGNSPLRLAVILDRCRTVNLLLASGAMLPACLLQDAWQSPDVTSGVLATLEVNYLCRLRAERGRLDSSGQSEERRHLFIKGIDDILKTIEGDTPWQAAWPKDKPKALSALMVEAVHAKCPVTAAFLHRAGAWSFLSGDRGASALATALEEGHKGMAELLVKHLGTSIYSDVHLLNRIKPEERRRLEQYQYKKEKSLLEDLNIREKSERGKKEVLQAQHLQKELYESHEGHERLQLDVGCSVLKLSVRKGLLQLAYLVVQVGRFPVDEILDNICDTTALHEAASHGKASCVAMLLDVGANPLQCDRYDQTPRHLAAMFGHKSTEQLLALHEAHKLPCRAGTTADQASFNYDTYLKSYEKLGCKERDSLSPIDHHDPERVTCKLMEAIGVQELWEKASDIRVDFSGGEALEVKAAVMKELQSIAEKIGEKESLYKSDLRLVGSSEDGSKIYCPDEFDVNLVITRKDVEVGVEKTPEEQVASKGKYKLVLAHAPGLDGNIVMDKLFLLLQKCLVKHTLQDKRLSFVPPCLSSTQVGVALDLAWQGKEFPLLLVGVDLVPVLELPWHDAIAKPKLMKDKPKTFHVSNTADGS
ncbi:ankyrin-2-like [Eriocheir sinensis]|uniref:ankyrin-2-like n=1 Tax=Eriocheir sinensis TaxID=95602 RepID=UPI0021C9BDEC|nr:ankyrin-2-like [Eriocheir sinensis]